MDEHSDGVTDPAKSEQPGGEGRDADAKDLIAQLRAIRERRAGPGFSMQEIREAIEEGRR